MYFNGELSLNSALGYMNIYGNAHKRRNLTCLTGFSV